MNAPSTRPLYQKIKDRIVESIATGEWLPGKKIPSENELVRELSVSRMTVNRALRELAQEGLLRRVAGVGTFVAEPPRHASLLELRDIAEEVRAAGTQHRAKLCRRQKEWATVHLAKRMELAAGSEVDHVTLVHYQDDLPIQHEDRWVNSDLVPGFGDVDFSSTTPSEYLLATIAADVIEHIVQAVLPEPAISELLDIAETEPCLRLERRTWNAGRVVTYAILTYPGSRYDLSGRYSPRRDFKSLQPAEVSPSTSKDIEP